MAGTKCEQTFLRKTEEEGFPETMCSYHRVFLGGGADGDSAKTELHDLYEPCVMEI